jgi:hypothetical protein
MRAVLLLFVVAVAVGALGTEIVYMLAGLIVNGELAL